MCVVLLTDDLDNCQNCSTAVDDPTDSKKVANCVADTFYCLERQPSSTVLYNSQTSSSSERQQRQCSDGYMNDTLTDSNITVEDVSTENVR